MDFNNISSTLGFGAILLVITNTILTKRKTASEILNTDSDTESNSVNTAKAIREIYGDLLMDIKIALTETKADNVAIKEKLHTVGLENKEIRIELAECRIRDANNKRHIETLEKRLENYD